MGRRLAALALTALLAGCISPPPAGETDRDASTPPDVPEAGDASTDGGAGDVTDNVPSIIEESEPNDEPRQAKVVTPGSHISGQVDPSSSDWWQFTIPEGPTILELEKIEFLDTDGSPSDDHVVVTLHAEGNVPSERAYETDRGDFRRFFIPEGGEHRLEIEDDSDELRYEFALRTTALPERIDGGESTMQTGDLSNLWPDIYEYQATGTGDATVTLESMSSGYDPFVILYAPQGGLIGFNDDSQDEDSQVGVAVEEGVTIWVVVTGWNMPSDGSEYVLEIGL
jgi:hypothetical protein